MGKTVVTIGTFDGVHRGHQAVLRATRRRARRLALESLAFAFEAPPRLHGTEIDAGLLLLPPDVKNRLLRRFVDRVVDASYPVLRDLDPPEFVDSILLRDLNADGVVVSESFRFGRGRAGDARALGRLASRLGIHVEVVPSFCVRGEPVSSTRVRETLRSGEVEAARRLLGRPPLLVGPVRAGDGIGTRLGFPTANLELEPRVLRPASGVYFGCVRTVDSTGHALVYIGTRPTIGGSEPRCEVHLLERPSRELLGETLEVDLLHRIREDRRFDSLADLQRQMEEDLAGAQGLTGHRPSIGRLSSG
jgi:riboflavin kinase/FMN adenylyltransferase